MSDIKYIPDVQAVPETFFEKQTPFSNTKNKKSVTSSKKEQKTEFQTFLDNEMDKLK